MRYSRMREWLARSNRDMRNPYGSRGGYVSSDRRGMDYAYDRMGDMARGREYDRRYSDRNYNSSHYQMGNMGSQYDREYGRDNATRRSGYFDYNTQDGNYDMNYSHNYGYDMGDMYGRDRNYDYGYDMARRRDYGEDEFKLSKKEIRNWENSIKGGMKFTVEQVMPIAQQFGIKFDEYSPELLTAVTNAMCSDFGDVVKGDVSLYVRMAKAFLEDKDFDGEPEEKAYLYYTSIVDKE